MWFHESVCLAQLSDTTLVFLEGHMRERHSAGNGLGPRSKERNKSNAVVYIHTNLARS